MSLPSHCPDQATLRALAAGQLDTAAAEVIRLHLAECDACVTVFEGLDTVSAQPGLLGAALPTLTREEPIPATVPAAEERPPEDEDLVSTIACMRPSPNAHALGRIGDHDVLSVLGRGGMGVVLKAFDISLHRTVAIKVLSSHLAASRKAQRRFLREARAAAGINHPNVVTIHAVEEAEGMPYLVMEYVAGQTLRRRIHSGGPFDLTSLLRIGSQIAAGLAAAHKHGVIHRDIKPANVMLEDGIERVKITDFGLALVALDIAQITSADHVVGTPAYMSPEQVAGGRVDPRTDLFSLGCVLYAMVTGSSPFLGAHALDIARRVTDVSPRPLHELKPTIPLFLSQTVSRLLEKNPDKRYQSAEEVHDLLLGHLARTQQGSVSDEVRGATRPAPGPRRPRRWWPVAAAILLAVLLAAFGAWRGWWPLSGRPAVPGLEPPRSTAVLTVAREGEAQFRSLGEALTHAGPGTTIRILDRGPYLEPLTIDDPERLCDLVIEAPDHAVLQPLTADAPVVAVANTPGVVLRGLQLRARDRQHCISVSGRCEGLTVEQVRLAQPPQSVFAAVALWPGANGTADRPIIFRDLDIKCGTLGVVVLGQPDEPATWIRVENTRFTGPGFQLTVEKAARDVRVTGNLFLQGKRGISLQLDLPRQSQGVVVANNTFFRVPEWLGFTQSSFDQGDITIANNLILQSGAVQLSGQDLSHVAGRWFHDNWWEPSPGADPTQVRLVAEPKPGVNLVSRDPASPDFLRPAAGTMPSGPGVGPVPWAYIGARPPATTAGLAEPSSKQP
jgi:hypothetical protein